MFNTLCTEYSHVFLMTLHELFNVQVQAKLHLHPQTLSHPGVLKLRPMPDPGGGRLQISPQPSHAGAVMVAFLLLSEIVS